MINKQFFTRETIKGWTRASTHVLLMSLLACCLLFIFSGIIRHGWAFSPMQKTVKMVHGAAPVSQYGSLDEYIEVALDKEKDVWKDNRFWVMLNEAEVRTVEPKNVDFVFLDIGKLTDGEEPALNPLANKSFFHKKEEIRRMQKLSWTISQDYQLPLPYAEKVVLEGWRAANRYGISPYLLLALIGVESSYQQFSKSDAGAIGLTQVIPKWHPEHMEEVINRNENIWSIATNMDTGASVLKKYLNSSAWRIDTALQKYNGALADPTKKYAKKVLVRQQHFLQKSEDPKLIFP